MKMNSNSIVELTVVLMIFYLIVLRCVAKSVENERIYVRVVMIQSVRF